MSVVRTAFAVSLSQSCTCAGNMDTRSTVVGDASAHTPTVQIKSISGGARPTSARVMISRFLGWSPASGSVLAAQGLELLRILCLPLSLLLLYSHSVFLSLSKMNKC